MTSCPTHVTKAEIDSDTQLSLDIAASIAFPDGTVSATTLRAEAARGKLTIFRIGKKYYTTLAEIEKMVTKCPVLPKVPISTCGNEMDAGRNGQSEMEGMKSARAALKASMAELKKSSRTISPLNTDHPSATVIRPKFPSRTFSRYTPKNEPR